jgi:hypothetical protein
MGRVTKLRRKNSGRRVLDSLPPYPGDQCSIGSVRAQTKIERRNIFNATTSLRSETYYCINVMKTAAFWFVVTCSPHRTDDRGSTHLWNYGLLQRDYTVLCPWRLISILAAGRSQNPTKTFYWRVLHSHIFCWAHIFAGVASRWAEVLSLACYYCQGVMTVIF